MLITRLRFFTIRLNIKPSFALVIPKIQVNASTENSAHSPTVRMKFLLIWFTSLRKTKTSTCFTSRRCGVLITRKLMSGILVCTLTTGRTTGASTNSTFISPRAVKNGTKTQRLPITKTRVMLANFAKNPMAGRRVFSIQKTTRCKSARPRVAKNCTAHTTITKMKNENPCQNFSSSFLSAGRSTSPAIFIIRIFCNSVNLSQRKTAPSRPPTQLPLVKIILLVILEARAAQINLHKNYIAALALAMAHN